jgi:diguanylate cyclase (GGDEF)-like protein
MQQRGADTDTNDKTSPARRVIVCDDDPDGLSIYKEAIKGPFEFVRLGAFDEVLPALYSLSAEIVFIDNRFDGDRGLLLCLELRRQFLVRPLQIVIVSREQDEISIRKGIEAGADDFLKKPLISLDLELRFKAALIRLEAQQKLVSEVEYYKQAVAQEESLSRVLLDRHVSLKETLVNVNTVKRGLERANQRLENIAHTDSLTGLLNRASLLKRMVKVAEDSSANGVSLCGIMLDVDYFKAVNDTYGHIVGDAVLKGIGKCLKHELRKNDFAGRYGGEEFFIVLTNTETRDASAIAERIARSVRETPHTTDAGINFNVTASMGISEYRPDENVLEWLNRADMAMYRSKQAGRDRVTSE